MNKKKLMVSITLFLCFIAVLFGFVKINLVNTEALSPIGVTNDSYKNVSPEFGEELSNFTQDNSNIKIYKEEDEGFIVRIFGEDYKISTDTALMSELKSIGEGIKGTINDMIEGIGSLLE